MTNKPAHLRFLLSLGNTKIVVLNNEQDLHIYGNQTISSKGRITAEHVTEALAK